MIELIFILIIIELVVGIAFIHKICMLYQETNCLNKKIKMSGITGNISEIKFVFRNFNKKLLQVEKIKQQKLAQKKLNNIFNIAFLAFSAFQFLKRRKPKKQKT